MLNAQTAEVISPPIFAASPQREPRSATSRERRKNQREGHADKSLIDHCVEYGVHVAGAMGAFDIDPTANNDFAAFQDDLSRSRAAPYLAKAARLKAKTMDGLRAKACVVNLISKNTEGLTTLLDDEAAFIKSLTTDVIRFQRAMSQHSSEIIPGLDR